METELVVHLSNFLHHISTAIPGLSSVLPPLSLVNILTVLVKQSVPPRDLRIRKVCMLVMRDELNSQVIRGKLKDLGNQRKLHVHYTLDSLGSSIRACR